MEKNVAGEQEHTWQERFDELRASVEREIMAREMDEKPRQAFLEASRRMLDLFAEANTGEHRVPYIVGLLAASRMVHGILEIGPKSVAETACRAVETLASITAKADAEVCAKFGIEIPEEERKAREDAEKQEAEEEAERKQQEAKEEARRRRHNAQAFEALTVARRMGDVMAKTYKEDRARVEEISTVAGRAMAFYHQCQMPLYDGSTDPKMLLAATYAAANLILAKALSTGQLVSDQAPGALALGREVAKVLVECGLDGGPDQVQVQPL